MSDGEFSVYRFFPDDTHEPVVRFVDAKTAAVTATLLMHSDGAMLGTTRRVIITDGGDRTNFEWKYGEGITYPPEEARS